MMYASKWLVTSWREYNRLALGPFKINSVLNINVDEWQEQVLNSEAFDILDYRLFVAVVVRESVIYAWI